MEEYDMKLRELLNGVPVASCAVDLEMEITGVSYDSRARRALAVIGANWFGHPAEEMTMIAVTGTCGKTTTTYLLKAILEQARGAKVGLIGTNQNMIGQEVIPTDRTTPESFEVQRPMR